MSIERKMAKLTEKMERRLENFEARMDDKFNLLLQTLGIDKTIQEVMAEEGFNKEEDFSGFQKVDNNFSCSHSRIKDIEQKVFDKSPPSEREQLLFEEIPKSDLVGDSKFVRVDFSPSQSLIGQEILPIVMDTEDLKTTSEEFNGTDEGVSGNIWQEFNNGFEGIDVHELQQNFEGMQMVIISTEGDKIIHEVWVEEITKFKGGTTCEYYKFVKLSTSNNVRFFGSPGSEAILNRFGSSFLLYGHTDFNRPFILEHEWQKGGAGILLLVHLQPLFHVKLVGSDPFSIIGHSVEGAAKLVLITENMIYLANGFMYDAKWDGIVTKQGSGNSVANCGFGEYNGAQNCFYNIYIMHLFGRYLNFMIAEEEEEEEGKYFDALGDQYELRDNTKALMEVSLHALSTSLKRKSLHVEMSKGIIRQSCAWPTLTQAIGQRSSLLGTSMIAPPLLNQLPEKCQFQKKPIATVSVLRTRLILMGEDLS